MKYRNFICYRGGSSAGIPAALKIYDSLLKVKDKVGDTYFSLNKEDKSENRNFMTDPIKYMPDVEFVIMVLTKHFFEDFLDKENNANPDSITRVEFDEALKNKNLRFLPVMFSDFSWNASINELTNKEIVLKLWGEEAVTRIVGSLPIIRYSFDESEQENVIFKLVKEIDFTNSVRKEDLFNDAKYKLVPTPSIDPKNVFVGREGELKAIAEAFESDEHVIFLQGIGGIGKTEIAKQYAKRNKHSFDTVVYATFTSSIMELVSSQSSFKMDPPYDRKPQDSDEEFFKQKLQYIQDNNNEKTLFIIDNFDVTYDKDLESFLNANYKVIITTRCKYSIDKYKVFKIEPLNSLEELKDVFMEYYDVGQVVERNDPHLGDLIELVNRHTYTIELIAQHMEESWQTVDEMIDTLKKQGIASLNQTSAYDNLRALFKVFNLSDDEKRILQYLALMPISGVNALEFSKWANINQRSLINDLMKRSWILNNTHGIALHPIARDVIRNELPLKDADIGDFLYNFNETIKEEYSWHFSAEKKSYYGEIALELINVYNTINEYTRELYRNTELLLSFSYMPARAVELATDLYNYYKRVDGENSYMCGYFAFQAGWTYLFNFHCDNSLAHCKEWFDIAYKIMSNLEFHKEEEFADYGHLLTHIARTYLLDYRDLHDKTLLDLAEKYAKEAVENAEEHFQNKESVFHTRIAVAYMQLAEVYIASGEYEKAYPLADKAYSLMLEKYTEDDPDTLNVSSRKSAILYHLDKYEEALEIGIKNLEKYTRFYGELNLMRFEQLVVVLRCYAKLGNIEKVQVLKEEVLRIGSQLLSADSEQLKDILNI